MNHCNDCGYTSDGDLDFCIKCGSKNIVNFVAPTLPEGYEVVNTPNGLVAANVPFVKKIPIALFLAFVPGLFDIFGLGQIVLKKYVKGVLFLASSAFCIAVSYFGFLPQIADYMWIISMAIFILQIVDLYRIITRGVVPRPKK